MSDSRHVLIPCPRCGALTEPLSLELQGLLERLKASGCNTASELSVNGHSRTWANNKLESLRHLNLVTREKRGRQWVYRAV